MTRLPDDPLRRMLAHVRPMAARRDMQALRQALAGINVGAEQASAGL